MKLFNLPSAGLLVIFSLATHSAHCGIFPETDIISQHAEFDGELRTTKTFLGLPYSPATVVQVQACETTRTGFEWTGWGFDLLTIYQPTGFAAWSISQQIAVYDPSSPVGNMGSIAQLLHDSGFKSADDNHLYMPAFGPANVSAADAPTLYTAIDLAAWVAGGPDYDWLGDYPFTDGISSLPGIKVATSSWAWDPLTPGGWSVDPSYLYSGTATIRLERDGSVPEPPTAILLLFGASLIVPLRARKRRINGVRLD